MAEKSTIICEDCGSPYDTVRRNTKYCNVCRLTRDLKFLTTRTSKCWLCDKEYAPTHSKDELCSECEPKRRHHGQGECRVCGTPDSRLYIPEVAICTTCMRNPQQRREIVQLLIRRVAWQQRQNDRTEAPA